MKVIVTCGPGYEPIDEVRRITNFSTGELGTLLADALLAEGFDVVCWRGSGATHPRPPQAVDVREFTTNDDLAKQLHALAQKETPGAIFHAAALCDYRVRRVRDSVGRVFEGAKLPSTAGAMTLDLEPAPKLISRLRAMFPRSVIVGWKYELDGHHAVALARAAAQITKNRTDACVVNGRAYGHGFGLLQSHEGSAIPLAHFGTKPELCAFLAKWCREKLG